MQGPAFYSSVAVLAGIREDDYNVQTNIQTITIVIYYLMLIIFKWTIGCVCVCVSIHDVIGLY